MIISLISSIEFHLQQDKYTIDSRRQIYPSNNKRNFWSKIIFEQQNQKKFPEKKILNDKIKKKIPEKVFFLKKIN